MGLPPTQMRWCCSECRTERSPAGAVCTSLHPRQGGVRRHPPRRARGCNSRVYARAFCVVCARRVGLVRRATAPPQQAQWATATG
jgi:hypothetical protein